MLTEHEIRLIKKSWTTFRNIDPVVVGDAFYSKLFFERPELRKMFPREMDAQYRKLVDMLNTIVLRLDRLDELTDEIKAMAQRHEGYGVKPEHYKPVGEALVWTLKTGMAGDWNEELKQAWINCYTILSNAMISAADKKTIIS
jgi:hemoglobin-like flavoprotein